MKYILHVDMNSFFASVEELQNPKYVGKPIAVGGKTSRTVISSANYIARSYGVKAAMPLFMAQKLCKQLIVVPVHFNLYQKYSEKFVNLICEKFTNNVEMASIDECYVDITSLITNKLSPVMIAKQIQQSIKRDIGLNSSIGVANNKFLAKIASDYKKPMGITTMWINEIQQKLWPQPIENMLFIGKSTAQLLRRHHINTIGDIANKANNDLIAQLLGKTWYVHYQHANGIGDDTLDYSNNVSKSIGASTTFITDTNNFEEIKIMLLKLTNEVVEKIRYEGQVTKTINIQIKLPNFKLLSRSITLTKYIDNEEEIFVNVMTLYEKHFMNKNIRLVGVSLSNLKLKNDEELSINSELFDEYKQQDQSLENHDDSLFELIKKINNKYSRNVITTAKDRLTK